MEHHLLSAHSRSCKVRVTQVTLEEVDVGGDGVQILAFAARKIVGDSHLAARLNEELAQMTADE